jgi:hypothetical protein
MKLGWALLLLLSSALVLQSCASSRDKSCNCRDVFSGKPLKKAKKVRY